MTIQFGTYILTCIYTYFTSYLVFWTYIINNLNNSSFVASLLVKCILAKCIANSFF